MPTQRSDEHTGSHPLRQLTGRALVIAKGATVGLLVLIVTGIAFAVITGAIGFGPGDDGFTGAFWLYLLANFVFMWAYGVHLRATSPHW